MPAPKMENTEPLPEVRYSILFPFLSLRELYNYWQTSQDNKELVEEYFEDIGYDPQCLEKLRQEEDTVEFLETSTQNQDVECTRLALDMLREEEILESTLENLVDNSIEEYHVIDTIVEAGYRQEVTRAIEEVINFYHEEMEICLSPSGRCEVQEYSERIEMLSHLFP